jgi:hypothetical protein
MISNLWYFFIAETLLLESQHAIHSVEGCLGSELKPELKYIVINQTVTKNSTQMAIKTLVPAELALQKTRKRD